MIQKDLAKIFSSLFEKQIAYLVKHSSLIFLGNMVLASIIIIAFYNHTNKPALLFSWFGLTLIVCIAKLSHNMYFSSHYKLIQKQDSDKKLQAWVNSHILFTTLLSILWGAAGLLLFPESLIHQTLLIVALSAVLISSITTLAASKKIFHLQIALLLLPIAGRLIIMEGHDYKILAAMIVIMGLITTVVAHYVYKVLYELHRSQQQTESQAHTDQLTQLANRRYFDKHFKAEWRRAMRNQQPLSLLMIDVDHFKLYNDNNGHQAGDQCLKALSRCMKSIAKRQGDLVARHGGEEFAILLVNTPEKSAKQLAETLRQNIIQLKIPHQSPSSLLDVVTVSIGISSCIPRAQRNSQTGEDINYPAMLLGAADRAMYQAKAHGRNRVEVNNCESKAIPIPLHKNRG